MKVSELGEFGLIDHLAKMANSTHDRQIASWQQLLVGIGDDAAVWQGDTTAQLATVDSLIQDIHFSLTNTSWKDLGWKALAVSLSDIAAMGGVPRYVLVALTLPAYTEVEDVTALYQGMAKLAQQTGVAIVGGDISRAPLVVITVTVLGNAGNTHTLTRAAATSGEQVAVTGHLGAAAAGQEMLTRQLQLNAKAMSSLRNAFLHPHPRIAEGQLLLDQGVRTAIDISDGLIADLTHICQQSQVGARVEIDRLPIHPATKANFGNRAKELALSGGEDYELIFTASAEVINKVEKDTSCPITVIGKITADNIGEVTLIDNQGNPVSLNKRGWEHFAPK